jgi:DNA-binding transcriptional MerR regulator
VLRYWESEFAQLKPMKRRGNRRYYQHHEVLLIRRIRELLYDQGFTISGARNRLADLAPGGRGAKGGNGRDLEPPALEAADVDTAEPAAEAAPLPEVREFTMQQLRQELQSIRDLLAG